MIQEPEYVNDFDKPVYRVNNLHVKLRSNNQGTRTWELQLNDQYFLIDASMLDAINSISRMSDDIAVSVG